MAGSHILRRGCCLALLLAASLPVMAAQVAIPPLTNGAGDRVDATIGIRLVDANGQNVVAFNASNLATEYRNLPLGAAGLTLTLAPQVALALPAGGATYYQIDAKWPGGTARWRFQVADTGTVETAADLQYVAPPMSTVYRVNDNSHRWQVTGNPWADQGLAKSPGSGLRCLTYLYPYVP